MIKKDVTFENLDGEEITRSFWFNLNEAELTKMNLGEGGGFVGFIERALATEDSKKIVSLFDEILQLAYGVRSDDGVTFSKRPEYWENFKDSDAYSKLFMDLLQNPQEAGVFFGGLVPKKYQAGVNTAIAEEIKKNQVQVVETSIFDSPEEPTSDELPQPPENTNTANTMLAGMSDEEKAALRAALG